MSVCDCIDAHEPACIPFGSIKTNFIEIRLTRARETIIGI